MSQISVVIHETATDGMPDMDALVGRVAFIFDGCVVSGWPLDSEFAGCWEADSDVGNNRPFGSVTHWLEFPVPIWDIPKGRSSNE